MSSLACARNAGGVRAVWLQRHATVSVPPPTVGATIARLAAAPPGDEDEAVVTAVRATRPAVPTRRVALGHLVLPVDPAPGFGGLLGDATIMPVPSGASSGFVGLGGRIPAPVHSFKN